MPRCLALGVLGAVLQLTAAAACFAEESPLPSADYGISTMWQLGGIGGWDYLALEPGGARLFISRGERVDVVETSSGRRAGIVANTPGVHGIAFEPDAILYEPRAQHVFAADGASNDISVLDPSTLQVLTSIALPGPPEFMVTDAAGTVFVNIETEAGKLVAIDAKSLKIKATWALPGCANPTGLALDAANHRLFSVCEGQVMTVTDSLTGKQVFRVAIGRGPDAAAFDSELGFVFSSNGIDGTLTVIHQDTPDQYRVIATVQTQKSARTMALDPATHRLFLAAGRLGDTPPATADEPHPRPSIAPDSFVILVAAPK
jgi:YVTN family beta-propeller protein